MLDLDKHDELAALADLGYLRPKFYGPTHWAAIIQQGTFASIVDGNREALPVGYLSRWQYQNLADASRALHDWNGDGQPREWISAHLSPDAITVWP